MPSTIIIDNQTGSYKLALHPPLSTLLEPCQVCHGIILTRDSCPSCRGTGRLLTHLDSADVCIIGNGENESPTLIGVEVKRIDDFVASINNGRLQDTQIGKMVDTYSINWLLIYGMYRCSSTGNLQLAKVVDTRDTNTGAIREVIIWYDYKIGSRIVKYDFIKCWICSPSSPMYRHGFFYDTVPSIEDAAKWIGALHRTWTRPFSSHHSHRKIDSSRKPVKLPTMSDDFYFRLTHAMTFTGVGYDKAEALALHFPTSLAMESASQEQLQQVKYRDSKNKERRIGEALARNIYRQARGL